MRKQVKTHCAAGSLQGKFILYSYYHIILYFGKKLTNSKCMKIKAIIRLLRPLRNILRDEFSSYTGYPTNIAPHSLTKGCL